ncbi:MAG: aldehyde dehydrogenase [Clostridiales bacterium]|nr:aldehyde dehydrogenase [Clostridiales bacterium]
MTETQIREIVEKQRIYFASGATLHVEHRLNAISRLKSCIRKHEDEISDALKKDLGKSSSESYMCETGLTLSEISYMQKHTRSFARDKTVWTPLAQFCSHSFTKPSPYGVTLIMSPWNYPFLLTMEPLVDALAAGNTVVLKPSAYSPNTSDLIAKMIRECFEESYVAVVTGGREENQYLLQEHFDYIFFTGSKSVGREVMRRASDHLTPVTLELGGKSPCIVDRTANLKLAAKRIVFGKYLNCGQTCVAPDYVYCDPAVKDELVAQIRLQIRRQFGKQPLQNDDYGKIINRKHFERIRGLIDATVSAGGSRTMPAADQKVSDRAERATCPNNQDDQNIRKQKSDDGKADTGRCQGTDVRCRIVAGGHSDADTLRIEPTVIDGVTFEDPIMQEEIFGPVLPILTYQSLDQAVAKINSMEHPLALYFFTRSRGAARMVMSKCRFGGGCVNDTVIHLATSEMGFGGFGESGMGSYHGKKGFDTFSHSKSIVDKKLWLDLPMRYQPYKKLYDKMIHMFLR